MRDGKFIILGVSGVLIVGVLIGLIVGINQNKSKNDSDSQALSSTTKSVASVCSQTDYKITCVNSMNSLAKNESATPRDFLAMAINVTIQSIQDAMSVAPTVGKNVDDPVQKMAVEDCKDLLQYAIAELQASFSMVRDSDLHTISEREAELKNWLSAVISYKESCVDGFTMPEIKDGISNGFINATQLTDNALAIVTAISQILEAFKIPVDTSAASRRLLDDGNEVGPDELSGWLPAGDRKLLASRSWTQPAPNAVVAQNGSGQYKTISAALAAYPKNMYGDGPRKTIVTGSKCNTKGFSTFQTASFSVIGNGFIAKSMGFTNTAGPEGHQAVALRVQSDMSVFYNCRMDGYQDTLYVQAHRQFYRNCVISGTVDFIFGDSSVVIQNCLIIVRKPMDNQQSTVTAQGQTQRRETTGIVIQNCRIVPEQKLESLRFEIPTFLGRPWKEFSRTVIMESTLADFVQPTGWMPWAGNFALDTLYYR